MANWAIPFPSCHSMKGVVRQSGLRMSEVIRDVTGIDEARVAVVLGPNLGLELGEGRTDRVGGVVDLVPRHRCHRRRDVSSNYLTTLTKTRRDWHGIRRCSQKPHRCRRGNRGWRRIRRQHQGIDHHARSGRTASAFASAYGARPETMWGTSRGWATSSQPVSHRFRATTPLAGCWDRDIPPTERSGRWYQTAEGLSSV